MALSETLHTMLKGVLFGTKEAGVTLRESPDTESYELHLPARKGTAGDAMILNASGALEFASVSEQAGTSYLHTQPTPSAEWTIEHHLGFYPSVTVVDSAGSVVIGDIQYMDLNTVRLSFSGAFSGSAYLS